VADNLHVQLAAAQPPVSSQQEDVDRRPNRSYAIGVLKPILAGCLLSACGSIASLGKALAVIIVTHYRRQANRSYPRPRRVKPHAHRTYRMAQVGSIACAKPVETV
jgi:hypothetical protein